MLKPFEHLLKKNIYNGSIGRENYGAVVQYTLFRILNIEDGITDFYNFYGFKIDLGLRNDIFKKQIRQQHFIFPAVNLFLGEKF